MRILAIISNAKLNIAKNPGKLFGFNNHCHFANPYGYKKYGFLGVISKYLYKNSLSLRKCVVGYSPTIIPIA